MKKFEKVIELKGGLVGNNKFDKFIFGEFEGRIYGDWGVYEDGEERGYDFDLMKKNDDEELNMNISTSKVSRFSITKKKLQQEYFPQFSSDNQINFSNTMGSPEDEYNLLKSMSVNFNEEQASKTRTNSILRLLEINIGEKRKLSNSDI